jgi:hypothetical protein
MAAPSGRTSRATSLFAHVGVRAAYEWRIDSFFFRAALDGSVAALRSVVAIDGESAWSMPYLSASGMILAGAVL